MRLELTLKQALNSLDQFSWDHDLYVKDKNLIDQNVLILDDEVEIDRDENDEPSYAINNGFHYFLSICSLQDVAENLKSQKEMFTYEDLVSAIEFYYQNNSFIKINSDI